MKVHYEYILDSEIIEFTESVDRTEILPSKGDYIVYNNRKFLVRYKTWYFNRGCEKVHIILALIN